MKKRYLHLSIVCLLFAATPAFAQKGLKVGGFALPQTVFLFNADDQALDEDIYRQELLGGMAAGAVFGYNFNDFVGFRLNLLYSQQGGKYSSRRDVVLRNSFVRRQEYLKLPLMLGVNSDPERKVAFVFYGGVQLDLLTKAYSYNDNPAYELPIPDNYTNFPSEYETYRALHYSVVGDIGTDIKLSPRNFVLNLRIRGDYGLVDSENKDASFRLTSNGFTRDQKYWEWVRGATANAETFSLNVGFLVGLTYTFGPVE
ncbi:MAG: outer membrane beta-barrel protein [Bacteroidia bacterium]